MSGFLTWKLQWSHRLSAMERATTRERFFLLARLQWSHRLSAMERSTYPLLNGRGLIASNGATAFRRWKELFAGHFRRILMLRPEPCFNGATAFRRWKACRFCPCPPDASERFNGATAFRRWKAARPSARKSAQKCFNGATAFRRWKAPTFDRGAPSGCRFNGATAFRRWKGWFFGRMKASGPTCFNGATAFRRWKRTFQRAQQRLGAEASMEPPPFGDGKLAARHRAVHPISLLQWSHRLSAMERTRKPDTRGKFRWLQWSHRISAMERHAGAARRAALHHASMEPPPFGDGKLIGRPP